MSRWYKRSFAVLFTGLAVSAACTVGDEEPRQSLAAVTVQAEDLLGRRAIGEVVVAEYALDNVADKVDGRTVNAYWFPAEVDGRPLIASIHAITDEVGHWGDLPALGAATAPVELTAVEVDSLTVGVQAEAAASSPVARVHASLLPGGAICGNRAFSFRATLVSGGHKARVYVGFHGDVDAGMGASRVGAPPRFPVPGPSIAKPPADLCTTYTLADCSGACQLTQSCTTELAYSADVSCSEWGIGIGIGGSKCWQLKVGGGTAKCHVNLPGKQQNVSLPGDCSGVDKCQCHLSENCPPPVDPSVDIVALLDKYCSGTCAHPQMPTSPNLPPCGATPVAADAGAEPAP